MTSRTVRLTSASREHGRPARRLLLCAGVVALSLGLWAASASAGGTTTTQTTTFTAEGETAYTIPANTTSLQVTVVGAAGATTSGGGRPPATPGQGAEVQATFAPPAGLATLYAEVGGSDASGGGGTTDYAAYGGGESAIQICSVSVGGCTDTGIPSSDPRLIVAGGGGGGGEDSFASSSPPLGGVGGNAGASSTVTGPGAGGNGSDTVAGVAGGRAGLGATASTAAVGTGSTNCTSSANGTVGTSPRGGNGGPCDAGQDSSGAGGGGGWVGGSGGGAGDYGEVDGAGGGGGAGASFVESAATNVTVAEAGVVTPEVVIVATIVTPTPTPVVTPTPVQLTTTTPAGQTTVSAPPSNAFTIAGATHSTNGSVELTLNLPGPGTVSMLGTHSDPLIAGSASVRLVPGPHRLVWARHNTTARTAGPMRITLNPNAFGRRMLSYHRHEGWALNIHVSATYTPTGGYARSVALTIRALEARKR